MGERNKGGSAPASLPASRAFVVQFSADTVASANRLAGRAEHIESGRCRRFTTVDELKAFVAACLDEEG